MPAESDKPDACPKCGADPYRISEPNFRSWRCGTNDYTNTFEGGLLVQSPTCTIRALTAERDQLRGENERLTKRVARQVDEREAAILNARIEDDRAEGELELARAEQGSLCLFIDQLKAERDQLRDRAERAEAVAEAAEQLVNANSEWGMNRDEALDNLAAELAAWRGVTTKDTKEDGDG